MYRTMETHDSPVAQWGASKNATAAGATCKVSAYFVGVVEQRFTE